MSNARFALAKKHKVTSAAIADAAVLAATAVLNAATWRESLRFAGVLPVTVIYSRFGV